MNKSVNVNLIPEIGKTWNQLQDTQYQKIELAPSSGAVVYLDTAQVIGEEDNTNILMSSRTVPGNQASLLFKNVSKLAVQSVYLPTGSLQNVTSRNNQIIFESSLDPGNEYTAFVPVGRYESITDLMDAVIFAMNVAYTGPGVPGFAYVAGVNNNKYFRNLRTTSGTYRINPQSSMVKFGKPLIGLPDGNLDSATKLIGPITLLQTRYVELFSDTLTKYNRIPSISNSNPNSNIIARVWIDEPESQRFNVQWNHFNEHVWIYFNPSEAVYQIDFQLRDEFGNFLYVTENPENKDPKTSFDWSIQLVIEH